MLADWGDHVDSGWAALLGTFVGSFANIGTTWLSEYLRNRPTDRLAKIRKERLTTLLSGQKYTWRELSTLCDAIGADEEVTVELLLEIGARRSQAQGKNTWALISRAPFPEGP